MEIPESNLYTAAREKLGLPEFSCWLPVSRIELHEEWSQDLFVGLEHDRAWM